MTGPRYVVALDPYLGQWMVLEESSDFNGWIVLMKVGSFDAAERAVQNMVEARRAALARVIQEQQGR